MTVSGSMRRSSLLRRLISAAKEGYDYPASNLVSLRRSFESTVTTIAKVGGKVQELRQASADQSAALAELEWRISGEGGHVFRGELYEPLEILTSRIESLEQLRRRAERALNKLKMLRAESMALYDKPVVGLKTQESKLLLLVDRIDQTLNYTNKQVKRLDNLSKIADSVEASAMSRSQLNAGFESLAMHQLLAAAYDPTSQLAARRVALAVLSRWATAKKKSPWSEIFENHYSQARNAFALAHKRNSQPITKLASNEFIGADAFETILASATGANIDRESFLRLSNNLGAIEQILQKDSRFRGEVQLAWLNRALACDKLEPISFRAADIDKFDQIECQVPQSAFISSGPLVSVLLPAFNSASWIPTAIESLLNQTWKNLEILVVDDQSTDNTYEVAKQYEARDSRIRVLRNETNSGPYVSRNLALKQARGVFVTVHDADDWSHPRKIERQVANLLENPHLIANTSQMVRVSPNNMRLLSAANKFTRLNYSSLMFRQAEVVKTIGFWDSVRFGADSEFISRLEMAFGSSAIRHLDSGLLSLVRSVETSLTAGGLADKLQGVRKQYKRLFTAWHKECEADLARLFLDSQGPRKFYAPRKSLGFDQPNDTYSLVLVDDLSDSSDSQLAELLESKGMLPSDFAYVHVPSPLAPETTEKRYFKERSINQEIANLRLIFDEYGEIMKLKSNRTVVSASTLLEKYSLMIPFKSKTIEVAFQTLEQVREVRQVLKNCVTTLGGQPTILLAKDESIIEALEPERAAGWNVQLL
jgi:glycosyltransferase involved in cell wall biosynthesis